MSIIAPLIRIIIKTLAIAKVLIIIEDSSYVYMLRDATKLRWTSRDIYHETVDISPEVF